MDKHTEVKTELSKADETTDESVAGKGTWWLKHKRKAYWAAAALLILLLLWWIWREPMARMWHNLFDATPTTQSSKASTLDSKSALATTGTAGGNATTRTGSTDTGKSTIARDESSKTTTTTTSTTTTTPDPATPGGTPADNSSLLNLYANLGNGLNKGQLISLAGTGPTSCTDIAIPLVGTQSICTWTQDGHSVVATLLNDRVIGKTKIGF